MINWGKKTLYPDDSSIAKQDPMAPMDNGFTKPAPSHDWYEEIPVRPNNSLQRLNNSALPRFRMLCHSVLCLVIKLLRMPMGIKGCLSDKTAVDTRVNFYDAETNELLEEQTMGPRLWNDRLSMDRSPQAYRDGNKNISWMY